MPHVIQQEPYIHREYFVKVAAECGKKKIFMPFYRLKRNMLIFNLSSIRFVFLRYLRFLCIAGSTFLLTSFVTVHKMYSSNSVRCFLRCLWKDI